jgi:type II secretory pathway component PulM
MKELWGRLQLAFDNLSSRERILLLSVGALVILTIVYFGGVQTILNLRDSTESRTIGAEQQLRVMSRLRREYDDVEQRLTAVEKRITSGTRPNLRTTLATLAQSSLVKIESMEPQATPSNKRYRETKVEVGLKEITLAQTVRYLHQIETAPEVLSVKSLRIRTRRDKPEYLDVTFTVSTFERL